MDKTLLSRLSRSAKDTNWFAWKRPFSITILSGIMVFFWLRQYGVQKDSMELIVTLICSFFIAAIVIPLFEFTYNFIKAPIWIAREEIEKLENELRDAKAEILQLKESSK